MFESGAVEEVAAAAGLAVVEAGHAPVVQAAGELLAAAALTISGPPVAGTAAAAAHAAELGETCGLPPRQPAAAPDAVAVAAAPAEAATATATAAATAAVEGRL